MATLLELTDTPSSYDDGKFLISTSAGTVWGSVLVWDGTNNQLKLNEDLKTDRWLNQDSNTFIGVDVVGAGNLTHTTGDQGYKNIAIGYKSLYSNTTGYKAIAIGNEALTANTTGWYLTALGYQALYSNTEGATNTAIGYKSLYFNTTGGSNTACGQTSLYFNTTGNYNTAIGYCASFFSGRYEAASANTSVGFRALYRNEAGTDNVVIGTEAGGDIEGSNNVIIGSYAGSSSYTMSGNILIGYRAGYNETGSNKLYISNSNTSSPLIYGEFDNNLVRINGDLEVTGSMPVSIHDHDDRYYTESEIDIIITGLQSQVDGKSDTGHNHDSSYYTETEIDTVLAGKSDIGHTHVELDITDLDKYTKSEVDTIADGKSDIVHIHDGRYYTETETDTLLAGKSDTSHIHTLLDLTDTPSSYSNGYFLKSTGSDTEWSSAVENPADKTVVTEAPTSAPTLSRNQTISFYIDETDDNLKVVVKYSDGTVKEGKIKLRFR